MVISIIVISACLLISLLLNARLINDLLKLNKSNLLKSDLYKNDFNIGDTSVITNFALCFNKGTAEEKQFSIDYEVEILEVTKDKVKVKCINFTHNDKIGADPLNRNGIIKFMTNRWIPKDKVELVMDQSYKRNNKLDQLGI